MKRTSLWLTALAVGLISTTAISAGEGKADVKGYLTGKDTVDALKFLPAPPALGSVQYAADEDVYLRMRALQDSPRWKMAQGDDDLSVDGLMKDFSCALGFSVTPKTAPRLAALFARASTDAETAYRAGKNSYKRPRPFLNRDLPLCVPYDKYAKSYSYPSGHTTLGWTFASILMSLMPERAGEIAARGRAFGESRAVCGVHWASDVEAGRLVASGVYAALTTNATFHKDLVAARAELLILRAHAPKPDAGICAAEDTKRPW